MTDKEKIRKEVERLRNLHQMKYQQLDADSSMSLVECGKRNLCNELLSFIDSLQEEPVSKDLEEATNNYGLNVRRGYPRVMDETDRYICNAFKAGAKWQKEQMMKSAVERIVKVDAGGYPYILQMELYDYDKDIPLAKEGDKYKVILIKEE